MSKYRKIEPIVDVVQWFDGDEHPALKFHNNCNYRMCEICGGDADSKGLYYIKSGWDNLIVRDSDWIIDLGKGYYRVMSDKYFKQCYEKIE
jgi:hypothetical protein